MNDLRVKYLSYDPEGDKRLLHIEFDPGDGTTITHRTGLPKDPDVFAVTSAIEDGWRAALRMISQRKSPDPPKLPQSLKSVVDEPDFPTFEEGVYGDPDYTVGSGPITPHTLLDAGD